MSAGRFLSLFMSAALMIFAVSCGDTGSIEPPTIRFGVDACAECAMIVSDERFAAGVAVKHSDGRYESLAFDDIGCILAYKPIDEGSVIVARFARHYHTHEWIEAEKAVYLHSPHLHSPMAFGVAALTDVGEARELEAEFAGDVLTFTEIAERYARGELSVLDFGSDFE